MAHSHITTQIEELGLNEYTYTVGHLFYNKMKKAQRNLLIN